MKLQALIVWMFAGNGVNSSIIYCKNHTEKPVHLKQCIVPS